MNIKTWLKKWRQLPRRRRLGLGWTVGLVLAYTLLGFLILPPIVRVVAVKQLSKLLDRPVAIKKIHLNPYVLSATIRGLDIRDQDGETLLSWQEVYANLQLRSFVSKPWTFTEVRLQKPHARVQYNRDRSLNFSDLLTKFSKPSPPPTSPQKPLLLHVDRLQIIEADASFTDLTPSTPFRRIFGPLQITLTDFHTDPNNKNPYAFAGTTDAGEKFSWSGHFSLDPLRSAGEFTLAGLAISKYAPLYQDLVRLDIKDGIVDMRSAYAVSWQGSNYSAVVSNAMVSLRSLRVAEKGGQENLLELDELTVRDVSADAADRRAEVGAIYVQGGRLNVQRNEAAQVNVVELAKPPETATNMPSGVLLLVQAATNAMTMLFQSTNQAKITLHRLDVTNTAFVWKDVSQSRPVSLTIDDITVAGRNFSNHADSNMVAQLAWRWNSNGSVRIETTTQLSPFLTDIQLHGKDVDLSCLSPYLRPFANVALLSSRLGLDARVAFRATNELVQATFEGDVHLDDLATIDNGNGEDLVKCRSIGVNGVTARLLPTEISVREISLVDPYAHVAIGSNRVLNVVAILPQGETNTPAASPSTTAPAPTASTGQSLGQRLGYFLRTALASNTNAAGASVAPKVTVLSVVLTNAVLKFQDLSVQPAVQVGIADFHGTLTGLSSATPQQADLHLEGKADRGSSIIIHGKINPLSSASGTEMRVAVHNVDLTPASPYLGKYAGYRLQRGKLNVEVAYQIAEQKLTAQNVLVLDNFTFGEKVESPDATQLPVRLAVAVLKDRNGKIELDVPIEGSLDDPQFRFGKVVTRTLVNVITKIATSPFSALGAVFGGKGEELSFQEFKPGEAELSPAGVTKLEALAKGLYERPGLSVEVEGSIDLEADRVALAQQKLRDQYRQEKWTALRSSERERTKVEQIDVSPEDFENYVKRAYAKAFSAEAIAARTNASSGPIAPGVPAASPTARVVEPLKGAQRMLEKGNAAPRLPLTAMQAQLSELVEITEADFRTLALRRAESVREYLVQKGQAEAERIQCKDDAAGTVLQKGSRAYISLR